MGPAVSPRAVRRRSRRRRNGLLGFCSGKSVPSAAKCVSHAIDSQPCMLTPTPPQLMVPICHCKSCRVYGGGPGYLAAFMPDNVKFTMTDSERHATTPTP